VRKVIGILLIPVTAAILAVFVYMLLVPTPVLEAEADLEPKLVSVKEMPENFTLILQFPEGVNVKAVNVSSVLLENVVPVQNWTIMEELRIVTVTFDGKAVMDVIWAKTYHMGITAPAIIELSITGRVKKEKFVARDTIFLTP